MPTSARPAKTASKWALACAAAASLLAACGTDVEPIAAIWQPDFETALVEVRNCRLSPAEHDGFSVRVFANPLAKQPYLDNDALLPEGALLVKGEYDDANCTVLARVSAMRKGAVGSDAALGDWRWQRGTPAGTVEAAANVQSCAGCHSGCKARDYACTDP